MVKVISTLEAIRHDLEQQMRKAIRSAAKEDPTSEIYLTGSRKVWVKGIDLETLNLDTMQIWMIENDLQLPSPVPYWYKVKETGKNWDEIKRREPVLFQTPTEAHEFARNLANLMGAEVRYDTGGSGSYIQSN